MRKGCFIKSVIIGTIFIAAAAYIIQNNLEDWLLIPGKEIVLNEIVKNWDTDLKYVYESSQKDSLKNLLLYYVDNIKSLSEVVHLDEEKFVNEFEKVIKDSLITDDEISKLSLLVKEELNEKSKSN